MLLLWAKKNHAHEPTSVSQPETAFCETCGGLFKVSYLHQVGRVFWSARDPDFVYYCKVHDVPYDMRDLRLIGKNRYYKNKVEVTEDGDPNAVG